MIQRVRDWRHERRINRLSEAFQSALRRREALKAWEALREAINQRSVAQVRRMERAKGLR